MPWRAAAARCSPAQLCSASSAGGITGSAFCKKPSSVADTGGCFAQQCLQAAQERINPLPGWHLRFGQALVDAGRVQDVARHSPRWLTGKRGVVLLQPAKRRALRRAVSRVPDLARDSGEFFRGDVSLQRQRHPQGDVRQARRNRLSGVIEEGEVRTQALLGDAEAA